MCGKKDSKKVRKKKIVKGIFIIGAFLFLLQAGVGLQAAEVSEAEPIIQGSVQPEEDLEEITGILDFSELDRFLEEEDQPGFSEYIGKCINGDLEFDFKGLWESVKTLIAGSFEKSRDTLVQILILSVAFSVLHNFANTFHNSQVSTISYYMVYLVLMVLLMRSFMAVNDLVVTALRTVMGFMNCLMPVFTLALVFSNGQVSALGFYEIALIIIYLVEYAVIYLLVPAVRLYVVLVMLNHIATEEVLSNLTALIRSGISWALKILFTFVIGLNVIQGLLGPALDQYKRSFMSKGLSAIPGVGNTVQSVSELILGTGMVIRNSVGVTALVILVVLCASPCIQMAVMVLFYKLAAAVMEPVTDKRISGAVAGVGSGVMLLFKSLFTVVILFFITIAVICAASGVMA